MIKPPFRLGHIVVSVELLLGERFCDLRESHGFFFPAHNFDYFINVHTDGLTLNCVKAPIRWDSSQKRNNMFSVDRTSGFQVYFRFVALLCECEGGVKPYYAYGE